jgi:predicted ribosomally synthesized peptide with nif11-like leader
MSDSELSKFGEFLNLNPEIAKKCATSTNYDEVAAIAAENGFAVTTIEIIREASSQVTELNDEQLESVAGGTWSGDDANDKGIASGIGAGVIGGASISIAVIVK